MTTNFSSNTTYNEFFQPCSFSPPTRFSDLKILNGLLHCLLIGVGWFKVLSLWASMNFWGCVGNDLPGNVRTNARIPKTILPPMFYNMCLHPFFFGHHQWIDPSKFRTKTYGGRPLCFFRPKIYPVEVRYDPCQLEDACSKQKKHLEFWRGSKWKLFDVFFGCELPTVFEKHPHAECSLGAKCHLYACTLYFSGIPNWLHAYPSNKKKTRKIKNIWKLVVWNDDGDMKLRPNVAAVSHVKYTQCYYLKGMMHA